MKDAIEDRKAHRMINKSKRKRSNSKYKQNSISSVEIKDSNVSLPRDMPRIASARQSLKNEGIKQK